MIRNSLYVAMLWVFVGSLASIGCGTNRGAGSPGNPPTQAVLSLKELQWDISGFNLPLANCKFGYKLESMRGTTVIDTFDLGDDQGPEVLNVRSGKHDIAKQLKVDLRGADRLVLTAYPVIEGKVRDGGIRTWESADWTDVTQDSFSYQSRHLYFGLSFKIVYSLDFIP